VAVARQRSRAAAPRVEVCRLDWRRLEYRYEERVHGAPVGALLALAAVVGVIGGAYGIGGGALIAPILIGRWALPVHTIAGATLFTTFLTSVVGVVSFQLYGHLVATAQVEPCWELGLAFGAGGLVGAYCGAALQRHLRARWIESFLGIVVSSLGVLYVVRSMVALLGSR
jgi:uncharacterized membrane protein YfcA